MKNRHDLDYLEVDDKLVINEKSFTVKGCMTLVEDGDAWRELLLIDNNSSEYWLSVNNEENKFSLFNVNSTDPIHDIEDDELDNQPSLLDAEKEITVRGESFKLLEKGTAKVRSENGDVDVDPGDSFTYAEYRSKDKKTLYAIEEWDDLLEYSYGEPIKCKDIELKRVAALDNASKEEYTYTINSEEDRKFYKDHQRRMNNHQRALKGTVFTKLFAVLFVVVLIIVGAVFNPYRMHSPFGIRQSRPGSRPVIGGGIGFGK